MCREDVPRANPFDGLPEGVVPLEYAVAIKALDEYGEVSLYHNVSPGLTTWEALGMVFCLADDLRGTLRTPSEGV